MIDHRRIVPAAVLFTGLLAALVLLGWAFDIRTLKSILPSLTTMKPNTAACLGLTAAALWLSRTVELRRHYSLIIWILGALVIAVAVITLFEYGFGWSAGIDELLFRDSEHVGTAYPPGRLAPGTAVCFVLLSGALLALDSWPRISHGLTLAAALTALIGMIGYLYNLPTLYGAGRYSSLALHTVAGFLALSAGILAARPQRGLAALFADSEVRPLLNGALLFPVILGSLTLTGQRNGWYGSEFTLALFSVLLIVLTTALVWITGVERQRIQAKRRQAEEDLRRLNLELESRVQQRTEELVVANKDLEAFSYSVSHDLRSPLTSIASFSQFLIEDHAERIDPEGRMYLERIRANAKNMARLISDILALSKASRGELRREDVDLSALASSVLADLSEREPGRTVETEIEPGLTVQADPRLARVALENLLGNAWKYTAKTPLARIRFGRAPGTEPVYFVADNGAGFEMKHSHGMFEPFRRLHGASEFEGSGIGLATVYRIVTKHGGMIRAEGRVDGGATFYFSLEPATGSAIFNRAAHTA